MKPCKDCTERTATCHIDCKAYKIYSVGEHVKKAEEKRQQKPTKDLQSYIICKAKNYKRIEEWRKNND